MENHPGAEICNVSFYVIFVDLTLEIDVLLNWEYFSNCQRTTVSVYQFQLFEVESSKSVVSMDKLGHTYGSLSHSSHLTKAYSLHANCTSSILK